MTSKSKIIAAVLSMGLIFSACSNSADNTNSNPTNAESVEDSKNESNVSNDNSNAKESANQGSVEDGSLVSENLNQTWKYKVYLPEGYDENSDEKYPVLYMLHGMGENSGSILEKSDSKDILDKLGDDKGKMIVVFVDGFSSFFIDSEHDKMMESAITDELIKHIDENYNTLTEAKDRAVGGLSIGGYVAGRLALKHPDLFSSAMLISPTVWENLDEDSLIRRNYRAFSDGKAIWSDEVYKENFPTNFIDENSKNVKFFIVSDEGDQTINIEDVENFANTLKDSGIDVEFKKDSSDGDHNWDYWNNVLEDGYAWTLDQFK